MSVIKRMDTEYTEYAWNALYDVVDSSLFQSQDADLIYSALENKLQVISFGRFLQRYLYKRFEFSEPFDSVGLQEYQKLVVTLFRIHHTPPSFDAGKTSARISTLAKNWLSQQTVNRKVVLLLGFGLGMTLEEVNIFFRKALREQGINAKDPFEILCWFCFKNQYEYPRFQELWEKFLETPQDPFQKTRYDKEYTVNVLRSLSSIQSEASLLRYVSGMKTTDNRNHFSYTARKEFDALYDQARIVVADLYTQAEVGTSRIRISEYESAMLRNDHFSDEERLRRVRKKKEQIRVYSCEDITPADIEQVICAAIPKDSHGNLKTGKTSRLHAQFQGKRFSRQHITDILKEREEVTRFDLITLNFFLYSQSLESFTNKMKRYNAFISSTNEILIRCNMGALYAANPYECFVLMCILSDDPLGTYADVLEKSYQDE